MFNENDGAGSSAADDLDLFEEEATGQPSQGTKSTQTPDKYTGKSVEDLIKMHQNAEKVISRQGQEVSTLRRTSDAILELKKPTVVTREESKPVTVEALLENPDKALKSVLDDEISRRTADSTRRLENLEARISERTFMDAHPDYVNDANDPAFVEWVQKSKLRSALGAQAASNNYQAADQLWELWGEHKELTDTKKPDKKQLPKTVRSAPANTSPEKRYSRAKLMELREKVANGDTAATARWTDPTFQANMIKAYQEDRVI